VKLKATGPDVAMAADSISALLGGEVGRKLSMHVVAACPLYLAPQDVPKDVVERETAIFR
jgi:translation elongation factor EF-Ts